MTKFDQDATPESEAFFDELYKSKEHYFYKVYEANKDCDDLFHVVEHALIEATMFSKSLERRARVAEEKLRIAVEALQCSWLGSAGNSLREHHDHALKEIERVGL